MITIRPKTGISFDWYGWKPIYYSYSSYREDGVNRCWTFHWLTFTLELEKWEKQ